MDLTQTRDIYNHDVMTQGSYLYTKKDVYSTIVATRKQSQEIHTLIRKFFRPPLSILDLGCGDGTYTIELARDIRPKKIVGFDIAGEAIKVASAHIPPKLTNIQFRVGDAYTVSRIYKRTEFTLGIFRGVLHHMEHPEHAIQQVAKIVDSVIVLEPNGFNPILKVIEKLSPYHKEHGEKSYWPPSLDRWFANAGYTVAYKTYFSIVPYFCPSWITIVLKKVEPYLESLPIINRLYCGGTLTLYHK